jgi:hypothetical protein
MLLGHCERMWEKKEIETDNIFKEEGILTSFKSPLLVV